MRTFKPFKDLYGDYWELVAIETTRNVEGEAKVFRDSAKVRFECCVSIIRSGRLTNMHSSGMRTVRFGGRWPL